jgi:hypothetical protein
MLLVIEKTKGHRECLPFHGLIENDIMLIVQYN